MAFAASIPLTLRAHTALKSRQINPVRTHPRKQPARMATGIPTALADRIFVRVDKPEEETAGGLVLTAAAAEKPSTGVVVSVGPGRYSPYGALEPMPVAEGDHVLWKDDFGMEIVDVDGEELYALRVPSIVAKW